MCMEIQRVQICLISLSSSFSVIITANRSAAAVKGDPISINGRGAENHLVWLLIVINSLRRRDDGHVLD